MNRARLSPGDVVLFQGGQTFLDSTLMPSVSGAPGKPITFGSYGSGIATISNARGAVWVVGKSYLRFEHLRLTTRGANAVIFAGSEHAGSRYITIRSCVLKDSAYAAVNSPNPDDAHWRIERSTISHVGDSGLIVIGSRATIVGNAISDTGWNSALDYGKHGIYAKGARMLIVDNRIDGFTGSGISLRSFGARVVGNEIDDGPIGISYFSESSSRRQSVITRNDVSGVRMAGFFYGGDPGDAFIVRDNAFRMAGGVAFDIRRARYTRLSISGNRISGTYDYALVGEPFIGSASFVEDDNSFSGRAPRFSWNGKSLSLPDYRQLSGQGQGDSAQR